MTDRTTRLLLCAIALGLWANAAVLMLRPAELQAQQVDPRVLQRVEMLLDKIAGALDVLVLRPADVHAQGVDPKIEASIDYSLSDIAGTLKKICGKYTTSVSGLSGAC